MDIYKTTNKNKANQFLITLPTWKVINCYKEWSEKNLPPFMYVAICRETHEDGQNHHHVVIHTKTKMSKSQLLKRFEVLFPKHFKRIDVRCIKKDTINHCIDYIKKEDPNVYECGKVPLGGRPKTCRKAAVNPWDKHDMIPVEEMIFWSDKKINAYNDEIDKLKKVDEQFKEKWKIFETWALETFNQKVSTKSHSDVRWFREFENDDKIL